MTKDREELIADLIWMATVIRNGFKYDPGHSDLDREQPINIWVTLGDWRKLDYILREIEWQSRG